ncbi:hypothetical protein AKJ51_05260 [candidate division MSBL1 archaeon SCGC-AAA382A20]|uniref:Stage II sporulation protein M n=1 Tax=candidate division MSBL1 archaeon SCGC-AAA382A20 TaxID=1698280 RepID=A0A133VFK6_9EURY|nr:hypothetical protein AKJ51_05260 [candidate division MSBL1 archaeon SCGC-AAA382A20]
MEKDYLSSIKLPLIFAVIIFVISLMGGIFVIKGYPSVAESLLDELRRFAGQFEEADPLQRMAIILLNNAGKAFMSILLGAFLGIFPVFFLLINGAFIGIFSVYIMQNKGIRYLLAVILPHGVIEIPAVLISAAIGIKIGMEFYSKVTDTGNISKELKIGVRFFFFWILPSLVLAAFIESFITPITPIVMNFMA